VKSPRRRVEPKDDADSATKDRSRIGRDLPGNLVEATVTAFATGDQFSPQLFPALCYFEDSLSVPDGPRDAFRSASRCVDSSL
jgi:hypothetical protein